VGGGGETTGSSGAKRNRARGQFVEKGTGKKKEGREKRKKKVGKRDGSVTSTNPD